MNNVITALVAFVFVCVVYPHMIKNRPQFYAALAMICIMILLEGLAKMMSAPGVFYFLESFLQVAAVLLLFLSAGGISWSELAGEMSEALDAMRAGGETKKTVIVPLTGEVPKPRVKPEPEERERIPLE